MTAILHTSGVTSWDRRLDSGAGMRSMNLAGGAAASAKNAPAATPPTVRPDRNARPSVGPSPAAATQGHASDKMTALMKGDA